MTDRRSIRCHVSVQSVDELEFITTRDRSVVEVNGHPHVYSKEQEYDALTLYYEMRWDIIEWLEASDKYEIVFEVSVRDTDPYESKPSSIDFRQTFAEYSDARELYDEFKANDRYSGASMKAVVVH